MTGEKVWLSRCAAYPPEELLRQVEEAFTALGVWEEIKPGMKVVLKPNLVMSSKPGAAIATHPALVAAVGRCVQKAGGEVLIAESPGGPYTPAAMKAIFRGCGYTDMARECGFSLYTECKSREVTLPRARRCRQLSVAEPFLEPGLPHRPVQAENPRHGGLFRGGEEPVRRGARPAKAGAPLPLPREAALL